MNYKVLFVSRTKKILFDNFFYKFNQRNSKSGFQIKHIIRILLVKFTVKIDIYKTSDLLLLALFLDINVLDKEKQNY